MQEKEKKQPNGTHIHLWLHLNFTGRIEIPLNESKEKWNAAPKYLMLTPQLTFFHKTALFNNLDFTCSHNVKDLSVQSQT